MALRTLTAVLAILAAGCGARMASGPGQAPGPLPDSSPGAAPESGPQADPPAPAATVYRDAFGVPHVLSDTDAGALFGMAWALADDDWPLMEENYLHALGRHAELVGEAGVAEDRLARALDIVPLSRAEYEAAPPRLRGLLDAFAAGANSWLAARPPPAPCGSSIASSPGTPSPSSATSTTRPSSSATPGCGRSRPGGYSTRAGRRPRRVAGRGEGPQPPRRRPARRTPASGPTARTSGRWRRRGRRAAGRSS